jgi:hypothetical protein
MPIVPIALVFTFQATSPYMSRVFTLMLALFPKLAKLLCLCRCLPFLCYTVVLSRLFFGVSFELNQTSFWICLKLISHALNCFIGSLEPSRMKSKMFFIYPLAKFSRSNGRISMIPYLHVATLVLALYSKRSFKLVKGFYLL